MILNTDDWSQVVIHFELVMRGISGLRQLFLIQINIDNIQPEILPFVPDFEIFPHQIIFPLVCSMHKSVYNL